MGQIEFFRNREIEGLGGGGRLFCQKIACVREGEEARQGDPFFLVFEMGKPEKLYSRYGKGIVKEIAQDLVFIGGVIDCGESQELAGGAVALLLHGGLIGKKMDRRV